MAPRLGVTPDEVQVAMKGLRFMDLASNHGWLDGPRPGLLPAAENVARIMVSAGLMKRVPVLDALSDPRFLPEAT